MRLAVGKIWTFVKLTRPVFLLGGALLYLLGVAIAASQGTAVHAGRVLLGQLIVTATQLVAQYANEYYDVEVDRLNAGHRTWFSGGSGVLASGQLAPRLVRRASLICALVALIAILAAGLQTPLVWIVGTAGLAGSWFYSAPPVALMSSGWGELAASLIVALLTPLMGYAMQAGWASPFVWIVCLPLVLIHMAMLIAFEFPDWQADRAAGKKTLAVRLGLRRIAYLHAGLIACAFLLILIEDVNAVWPARFLWLAVPLGVWQVVSVLQQAGPAHSSGQALTLGAVGLFVLASALTMVGFV